MPEDTEETLRETAELIQEIDTTRVAIFVAKPLLSEIAVELQQIADKKTGEWLERVEKNRSNLVPKRTKR